MKRSRAFAWLCLGTFFVAGCDEGASSAGPVRAVPKRSEARAELFEGMIAADKAAPPKPCAVVLVGSSTIARWKGFADDLAPHYALERGVGGATINDLQRFVAGLLPPLKPAAVVLYIGENDIAMRGRVNRTFSRYREVVVQAIEAVPATPIYLVSLKLSPARARRGEQVAAFNNLVKEYAQTSSQLHFVDVAGQMKQAGQVDQLYGRDRQHLSEQGYAVWGKAIGRALRDKAPSCRS